MTSPIRQKAEGSSGDLSSCCKAPVTSGYLEEVEGFCKYICTRCGQECSLVNPENHKEER